MRFGTMDKLIEVIGIKEEYCTNCHQCIAVCPVKVCSNGSGEVIKFDNRLCIGCGRCIEACVKSHGAMADKSARFAIDDAARFEADVSEQKIIALVAPSAQSNFPLKKLITALRQLGVQQVYDVSLGAEITVACYHRLIQQGLAPYPMIATPCPSVVRFIRLNHPNLIEHLAPVGSPVFNLATYVREQHPSAKLAFISPCLEKRREFQESRIVQYNITYQSLEGILNRREIDIEPLPESCFDNPVEAGIATNFSTPGGLKESYLYHYPDTPASSIARMEGMYVFKKYLPDLEKAIAAGKDYLPKIIDILSCDHGCNMGVGCLNKIKGEVEHAIAVRSEQASTDIDVNQQLDNWLARVVNEYSFEYRNYTDLSSQYQLKLPTQKQLEAIYSRMYKEEDKDFRNCAACGYNSCYQMAVAVFNGLNKVENCHLYQEKKLSKEQQALQSMHDELSSVFKTMSDGVIVLGRDGRIRQSNLAAQKILGRPNNEIVGIDVENVISGKAKLIPTLLSNGEEFYDQECWLEGREGKVHATASGIPMYDENYQVEGASLILRSIAQVQQLVTKFTGAQASFTFDSIIGQDKQLQSSIQLAMSAGRNNSTVLLQGESGSGKEMFAQSIHNASQRRNEPFVAINCAALPRELVASELFGYVEGAFTGAQKGGRPGKFELAHRGTLFLDEIGSMPLEQQALLLRAIQEKAILRVGGANLIKVDVRIIAATNQDLLELVGEGRFRADLFYRLNVIKIIIPPLRERRRDIDLLFNHFIEVMSPRFDRSVSQIDSEVIEYIEEYNWPGNIRELQNVVERILLLAEDGHITVDCLPREITRPAGYAQSRLTRGYSPSAVVSMPAAAIDRSNRKLYVQAQEKEEIVNTLNRCGGNVSKAADELGMSRYTLYRRMKSYDISN